MYKVYPDGRWVCKSSKNRAVKIVLNTINSFVVYVLRNEGVDTAALPIPLSALQIKHLMHINNHVYKWLFVYYQLKLNWMGTKTVCLAYLCQSDESCIALPRVFV